MTFRLEITQVEKFFTSWSLTKSLDFGTHAMPSLRGPTLPLAPSKTDGLIFVDLREKFLSLLFSSLSLSLSLSLFTHSVCSPRLSSPSFISFPSFFLFFFLNLDTWLTLRHVSITHSGSFLPRNNLFLFSSIYFN